MKQLLMAIFGFWCAVILSFSSPVQAEQPETWSVRSTVKAANPELKQEQESRRIAEQNLQQAKAGHRPRIDVQGGAGWRTVSVPRK